MEIHVQMRAVNLYTLTRKIDNEIYAMYEMALSDRAEAIRIRMEEIDQIAGLVNSFILFRYLILERNLICLKLEITKLL